MLFSMKSFQDYPRKSLMRFKCVSKSYNSVISSRDFTKLYLRYNPSDLLILPGNDRIKCYDLDSTTAAETFTWNDRGPIYVVGSTNGVLCIYTPNATNQLLLLNPTTRVYRDIPNVPGCPNCILHAETAGRLIGFAFDHENNDFIIVRVYEGHSHDVMKPRVTQVYSLNNNSWKVVDIQPRKDSMQGSNRGGILINNHLLHWMFWMYWDHSLLKRRICCFDVCKDEWVDDVLLPQYYYDPSETKLILLDIGVLNDRLFSSFETARNCYDVWLMKEYGVQDSWIKLVNFSTVNGVGIPGGVVPLASRVLVGDILIRWRHKTCLFWHNLMDGGRTDAKYDGSPVFSKLQVFMCARSQVDIPGGKLFGYPLDFPG